MTSPYLRYQYRTYAELCTRVASTIGRTAEEKARFQTLLERQKFLPAGNTWMAGVQPIRPNCCILEAVTPENEDELVERSIRLWKHSIGIGFDVSQHPDPVRILRRLSLANKQTPVVTHGRPMRGNMAVLPVSHPRILEFVSCKDTHPEELSNFNISVGVQDQEMWGVRERGWKDEWFVQLVRSAWKTGDPGVVFVDRIQSSGLPAQFGPLRTTVPCGEQSLHENECCNLGSVNLSACTSLDDLERTIRSGVQFLDRVVDLLDIPDPAIAIRNRQFRRIGLGVMGFADLLERQGIAYDSCEAFLVAGHLARTLSAIADDESKRLAVRDGSCMWLPGYRHFTRTCIAPTGGITLLTNNRGFSIEPFFAQATSIAPAAHVAMQACWQRSLQQSVSKTVNLAHTSTFRDVATVFWLAFEMQCKSVTVFRDGCRSSQPQPCTRETCA